MRGRSLVWFAVSAIALAALLAPYLVAWRAQPPDFAFSGFLVNPIDGFSYLAKMRQGAEGSWLFQLPYAAHPGPGVVLFLYYILLGHLQRWIGGSPLLVYHAARILGAAVMFAAASIFYLETVSPRAAHRWAMALTLFASGLGWLGVAFGRIAIDLWVPEAIPFFAAYANAHFPLAAAAMLTALTSLAAPAANRSLRFAAAVLSGLVLAVVQPFAVIPVVLVGALWAGWNRIRPPADAPPASVQREQGIAGLLFAGASAPWLVYDLWATQTHAPLAAWSAQNLTPTPPLADVVVGFGLVLALAFAALIAHRPHATTGGRMLVSWLVVGALLVFIPFGLQRRMLLGVFFPMAALAGVTLAGLAGGTPRRRWLAYILFILCLPSNLVMMTATLGGALTQQPEVILTEAELAAYRWASNEIAPGALILAGAASGNRLPAFADVRVVYGHPFETPEAKAELEWVESVYSSDSPARDVLAQLRARSVEYVLVGPAERALGRLAWLAGMTSVYTGGDVSIYRVPES